MIDLIQEKLKTYAPQTRLEEENAIKEILQEVAFISINTI